MHQEEVKQPVVAVQERLKEAVIHDQFEAEHQESEIRTQTNAALAERQQEQTLEMAPMASRVDNERPAAQEIQVAHEAGPVEEQDAPEMVELARSDEALWPLELPPVPSASTETILDVLSRIEAGAEDIEAEVDVTPDTSVALEGSPVSIEDLAETTIDWQEESDAVERDTTTAEAPYMDMAEQPKMVLPEIVAPTTESENALPAEAAATLEQLLDELETYIPSDTAEEFVDNARLRERLLTIGYYLPAVERIVLLKAIQDADFPLLMSMIERLLEEYYAGVHQEQATQFVGTQIASDEDQNVSWIGRLVLRLLRYGVRPRNFVVATT